MDIIAPTRQTVSNVVIFLVPYLKDNIQVYAHNTEPIVSDNTPIPAPLLNIAITPVTCKMVHISQVYKWGVVLPLKISFI